MTQITSTTDDWRTLVARKRKRLDTQIPSEWRLTEKFLATIPANGRLIEADVVRGSSILSEKELSITENYSATELLDELSKGEISSVEVTTAFCKRAAIAQQLVCPFFLNASNTWYKSY